MAETNLADLEPGDSFQECFVLRSKVETKKKGGSGPELKFLISDGTKVCKAKIWSAVAEEVQAVRDSLFLWVSGTADAARTNFPGELTITAYQIAPEPENIEPFLSALPEEHSDHVKRFRVLLKSIQEPNLGRLLRDIFQEPALWKQFQRAAAAQSRHHAYRGGLLEHSVEVAELCDHACQVLPHLKRDFLVTCALLHDIGKLEEMDHGLAAGEFTEVGILLGHTLWGVHLVGSAADRIDGFPKSLKSGLMHMISSHHGIPEWGAAKTPACAEAFVLHSCDNLSAKAHECRRAAESAASGQLSVKVGPGEYCYTGDFGLQPPLSVPKPEPIPAFITLPPREAIPIFKTARLPVKGMVAAGSPDQSSEEELETRKVSLPSSGADYLLKVTGDSMVDANIFPGDLLLVKSQETAKSNEIVIAGLAGHGDVVKRLRREKRGGGTEQVWLHSENKAANYAPICADQDTRIQGIVVGVLKEGDDAGT